MSSEHDKMLVVDRGNKNVFLLLILVAILVLVAAWSWRG